MPVLPSDRHEIFAKNIASGMLIGNAYAAAGYKRNAAAASKLASSKAIKDRVAEIKEENKAKLVEKLGDNPTTPYGEVKQFIEASKIDLDWVVEQYQNIYTKAVDVNQFGPANAAVANIQKIVEARDGSNKSKVPEVPAISVTSMLSLMKGMSDMMGKGQLPPPVKTVLPIEDAEIVEVGQTDEDNE